MKSKSGRRSFLKVITGAATAAFVPIKLPAAVVKQERPYPTLPIRYVDALTIPDPEGGQSFTAPFIIAKDWGSDTRVPVWMRAFSRKRSETEELDLHVQAAFGRVKSHAFQTLANWTGLPIIKSGRRTIHIASIDGLQSLLSYRTLQNGDSGEAYLIGVKLDDETELLGPWADSFGAAFKFVEAMQPWNPSFSFY